MMTKARLRQLIDKIITEQCYSATTGDPIIFEDDDVSLIIEGLKVLLEDWERTEHI